MAVLLYLVHNFDFTSALLLYKIINTKVQEDNSYENVVTNHSRADSYKSVDNNCEKKILLVRIRASTILCLNLCTFKLLVVLDNYIVSS